MNLEKINNLKLLSHDHWSLTLHNQCGSHFLLDQNVISDIYDYILYGDDSFIPIFKNDNDDSLHVSINNITINSDLKLINIYLNIEIYKDQNENQKNHRYNKNLFLTNENKKIINTIGFIKAQEAHSKDSILEQYIPLRDYLTAHKDGFNEELLYYKDPAANFSTYRHKNLFSEFKDEISDFEKKTFINRDEKGYIYITYKLDQDILFYNQDSRDLLDRKRAREFAKEVYNKKTIFTDKELLHSLKDQDVFVKKDVIISKYNKSLRSKVNFDDMDNLTLRKTLDDFYLNLPENYKNRNLNFNTKKYKNKKRRLQEKRYVKFFEETYYKYEKDRY